jgi:multisubunit Na+/H+ antiporter MnhB subunit
MTFGFGFAAGCVFAVAVVLVAIASSWWSIGK